MKKEPEHYWNHRVATKLLKHSDYEERIFYIVEAHYEKGKLFGFTQDAIGVLGENAKSLRWTLNKMKKCLDKPIIDADNFPNNWEEENGKS